MLKKILLTAFFIVLIGGFTYAGWIIFLNYFSEPIPLFVQESTPLTVINGSSYSSNLQFFPNLRFAKKEISYFVSQLCSEDKKKNMEDSFRFIEERTSLVFFEREINPEVTIHCNEYTQPIEPGTRFIAGEGGPTKIINTSLFNIIEKGDILLLYKENQCNNFNIEIHEFFHVLGFDHSSNENSIMYNLSSCNQIVTSDIIDEINRIYAFPQLPEIMISDVSATKHGMYLDMAIELRNVGLKESGEVEIEVYLKDKKTNSFNVSSIDYGEGKVLSISNVYAGMNLETFRIRAVSPFQLSGNNPEVELSI